MSHGTDRGRKRFRWADAIALLLALLLFLGALVFYWCSRRKPAESVELLCVFLISGMELRDWEAYGNQWMQVGDPLYSSNGTVILGRLAEVVQREHSVLTVRDGESVWEAHPFLMDLEIAVRISATYRGGDGLRAGDLRIAAGGYGDFRFGDLLASAQILEIREMSGT